MPPVEIVNKQILKPSLLEAEKISSKFLHVCHVPQLLSHLGDPLLGSFQYSNVFLVPGGTKLNTVFPIGS